MRRAQTRSRSRAIIIPILLQFVLIGGFIAFIIFSQQTLQENQPNYNFEFNGISNVELSPAGKQLLKQHKKEYLIPIYQAAAAKYKIPWEYLLGINYIESTLWTNQNASSVGAIGPMQFMERTWVGWSENFARDYPGAVTENWTNGDISDEYYEEMKKPSVIKRYGGLGIDGDNDGDADPKDEVDAIFSAANYLARHGMDEGKIDKAIFAYNHSPIYVADVKEAAHKYTQPMAGGGQEGPYTGPVSGEWGPPLDYKGVIMTSPYSQGTCDANGRCNHGGVDYAAANIEGQPIYATNKGMAYGSVDPGGFGYYVKINHGNGIVIYYGHMKAPSPIPPGGQEVEKGDFIGYVGTTGNSTGPHLHYEVRINGREVAPYPYLTSPVK